MKVAPVIGQAWRRAGCQDDAVSRRPALPVGVRGRGLERLGASAATDLPSLFIMLRYVSLFCLA